MGWFSIILCLNSPHTDVYIWTYICTPYTRNKIQYIILFNANIFTSALMKIDVLSAVYCEQVCINTHNGHGEIWLWMWRLKIVAHHIMLQWLHNSTIVQLFSYFQSFCSNTSSAWHQIYHLTLEITLDWFAVRESAYLLRIHSYFICLRIATPIQ